MNSGTAVQYGSRRAEGALYRRRLYIYPVLPLDRCWVQRLRRDGAPIPRWQLAGQSWWEGDLRVEERKDPLLGRSIVVATITVPGRTREVIPDLLDARLIQGGGGCWILTGLERDETTRKEVGQTWRLVGKKPDAHRLEPAE